jgi:hypothetical protein
MHAKRHTMTNLFRRIRWNKKAHVLTALLCMAMCATWIPAANADVADAEPAEATASDVVNPQEPENPDMADPEPYSEAEVPASEPDSEPELLPEESFEPTEEPSELVLPTETPMEIPTLALTDSPTVTIEPTTTPTASATATATPEPFDPELACARIEGGNQPTAGASDLGWLDCTVVWDTARVFQVSVNASTSGAGWDVVVIDPQSFGMPIPETARTSQLELRDNNPADDGFFSARFLIGSHLDCTAASTTEITLQLVATSHSSNNQEDAPASSIGETAVRQIPESGIVASAPTMSVTSATFAPLDVMSGTPLSTTGTLVLSYDNASPACGWSATLNFADFDSGTQTISSAGLIVSRVSSETAEPIATSSEGSILLDVPPSASALSSDGSIELEVELWLDGFVPQGEYRSTVTVETRA